MGGFVVSGITLVLFLLFIIISIVDSKKTKKLKEKGKKRLCIDCKYLDKDRCTKDSYMDIDPITGNQKRYYNEFEFAVNHRSKGWFASWAQGCCGVGGKWFESK